MNILIVKLSAIGDVIHTLPALNALRKQFPGATINWLVEEAAADLLIGHPALNRVLVSRRKQWLAQLRNGPARAAAWQEMRRFWHELRDTRYDMVLDFQALLKSGLLLSVVHGARKIGFDKGMQHQEHSYLLLNERLPPVDMEVHALDRNLEMLRRVGIPAAEVAYGVPLSDAERERVTLLLRENGISPGSTIIAINPMTKWETKNWDNRKFAALADRLLERSAVRLVFTGARDDWAQVTEIMGHMQGRAANLAGKTSLKELAALYEKCACLISTDTGPMHLGAAMNIPVVALFGPTAPWRTGPYGEKHQVVRLDLPCSPCFKRRCDTTRCMAEINVDQVLAAVARVVGPGHAKSPV